MILITYNVREGAEADGYEQWLRDIDNPFFNSVPGIRHYTNWKVVEGFPDPPLSVCRLSGCRRRDPAGGGLVSSRSQPFSQRVGCALGSRTAGPSKYALLSVRMRIPPGRPRRAMASSPHRPPLKAAIVQPGGLPNYCTNTIPPAQAKPGSRTTFPKGSTSSAISQSRLPRLRLTFLRTRTARAHSRSNLSHRPTCPAAHANQTDASKPRGYRGLAQKVTRPAR